jgi:hypothetical protein
MRLVIMIISALAIAVGQATAIQDSDVFFGVDGRKVSGSQLNTTLEIIEYRVETQRAVEPLLIFSPFSDPDVLGLIATDENLPLAVREVAANAILDQLYLADPYFKICSSNYLRELSISDERSLRLKGILGVAILEYTLFQQEGINNSESRRILRLQYAASQERDPQLRRAIDELTEGDPSVFIGSAAWEPLLAARKPYRRFDTVEHPAISEVEKPGPLIAAAWNDLRTVKTLSEQWIARLHNGESSGQSLDQVRSIASPVIEGFLARIAATIFAESDSSMNEAPFFDYFETLATTDEDPRLRSLALVPLSYGPAAQSREVLFDVLGTDQAALVRLSAANAIGNFSDDVLVRNKLMDHFRGERDPRVRLFLLHALVRPFSDRPPADVLAFMSGLLVSEPDPEVLEFTVYVLGKANVRSAAGVISRLMAASSEPILRARLAEALAEMGLGRRSIRVDQNPD